MNKKEYFEFAEKFFGNCIETSRKKNADYTGDNQDPFANFSNVVTCGGASTEQGFLFRITDKLMRISSFVKLGQLQVKDESVLDTLSDLANYCCLLAGYIESKKIEEPNVPDITSDEAYQAFLKSSVSEPLGILANTINEKKKTVNKETVVKKNVKHG